MIEDVCSKLNHLLVDQKPDEVLVALTDLISAYFYWNQAANQDSKHECVFNLHVLHFSIVFIFEKQALLDYTRFRIVIFSVQIDLPMLSIFRSLAM